MRVAIVGMGGLGIAHACACGRIGWPVVCMVERHPETIRIVDGVLLNEFDGIDESVPLGGDCKVFEEVPGYWNAPAADLVIIATPPHVFAHVIDEVDQAWPNATILCEKPVWLSQKVMDRLGSRLRMSCEYSLLTGLKEALDLSHKVTIYCTRPTATTSWGYRLTMLMDYTPHFGAMLWRTYGQPSKAGWVDLVSEVDRFHGTLIWGDRQFKVRALRDEFVPWEWVIGDRRLRWEFDLLDKQLVGDQGLPIEAIRVINELTHGRGCSLDGLQGGPKCPSTL